MGLLDSVPGGKFIGIGAGNLADVGGAILHPNQTAASVSDSAVKDTKKHVHLSAILATAFDATEIKIALPVTMAESGGDPKVVNPLSCGKNKDGTIAHAVGLMQVCTVNAGVAGFSVDPHTFTEQMKDPYNNVKAGKAIKDSQGWGAWETYTNGAYRRKGGQDPLITITDKNSLTDNNIVNAVTGTVDATGSALSALVKFVSALFEPSTYFRLGKGVLGGTLVIVGVIALTFMVGNKVSGGKLGKATTDAAMVAAVA